MMMHKLLAVYGTAVLVVLGNVPAFADSAPGQTVNVTPNQQTTTASATSSPTGQNISQQNNFSDPGVNSFGPGIQCGGPYVASSIYRDNSSNPGSAGVGGYSDVGGTLGVVVPLNSSNKKCQEFVNEVLFQRQIDTCLSMAKQGFSFDPNGQYASLAKRCEGIHYTGSPVSSANPVSPPAPPTVITVPAVPQSNVGPQVLNLPARPVSQAVAPQSSLAPVALQASSASAHVASYCQPIAPSRKHRLLAKFKAGIERKRAVEILHAACVPDAEIMAAL